MSTPVTLQFSQAEISLLNDGLHDRDQLIRSDFECFLDPATGEAFDFLGVDIQSYITMKRQQLAECRTLRQRLVTVLALEPSTNTNEESAA